MKTIDQPGEHPTDPTIDHFGLSDDDRRLLHELSSGRSDKRAAVRLDSSDRTVRRRMSAIMRLFGVTSRFTLGVMLGQLGLLQVPLPLAAAAPAVHCCQRQRVVVIGSARRRSAHEPQRAQRSDRVG